MKTSKDCKIKQSLLTFIGAFYLGYWSFVIWGWLFVNKIYWTDTTTLKFGRGKIPTVTLMVFKLNLNTRSTIWIPRAKRPPL